MVPSPVPSLHHSINGKGSEQKRRLLHPPRGKHKWHGESNDSLNFVLAFPSYCPRACPAEPGTPSSALLGGILLAHGCHGPASGWDFRASPICSLPSPPSFLTPVLSREPSTSCLLSSPGLCSHQPGQSLAPPHLPVRSPQAA